MTKAPLSCDAEGRVTSGGQCDKVAADFLACTRPGSSSRGASEQVNGVCPSSPDELVGTKGTGESCTSASDCAPTCCTCADAPNTFLRAECRNGKCAAGASICGDAESVALYCAD